ncbi:MAG: hypothetical protein EBQ94_13820, partial [Flavobacteriales bacterium]|nr:hypothetical protein [Flavobacteriales bacterium]
GRTIKVSGSTNFPDGTVIEIQTSGFIVSSKESGMSDTYKEVKVKDGKFLATLNPWNITDTIEFRIFTNKQSKDILDIVGKTGEKIKINPANKDDFPQIVLFQSDNYAVNEDIISKIKGEKSKDYKFQTASELNKPYEKVLAEFAKSWKDKDWKVMATYCQPSANTKSLAPLFDLVSILGFEVISSKQGTPLPSGNIIMEVEFSAVVKSVNGMKGIQSKKLKANVIQENGKWGVNPTSVTRNLYD